MKRLRQLLIAVLLVGMMLLSFPLGVQAQARQGLSVIERVFTTATGEQIAAPVIDTNGLTLSNFPPMQVTNELLGKLGQISPLMDFSSIQQSIGQFVPLPQVFPIGSAFGAESLSMENVADMAGTSLGGFSLNDIGGFKNLPLNNLVEGIPGLGDLPLGNAQGIAAMALSAQGVGPETILQQLGLDSSVTGALSGLTSGQIGVGQLTQLGNLAGLNVSEALQAIPGLGNMSLTQLDPSVLTKLALDNAIPGLTTTIFSLIPGAAQVPVAGVPGLSGVPVSSLPQGLNLIPNPIPIRMDVVFGPRESNRSRPVSGTVPDSSLTLKPLACDKNCAHVEIMDLGSKKYNGYAWMSGDHKGPDCFGSFCALFGSEGPSGSHPYGPAARVVLRNLDEKTGTVQAALAFRFCATIPFEGPTCSSANAFEIPFATLKEGQTFVMSEPGAEVGMAPEPPGFGSDGMEVDGQCAVGPFSGSAAPVLTSQQQAISKAIIAAAPAGMKSAAAQSVPRVLSTCMAEGVTDPAQLAYVMATMQSETSMGASMTENSATACSSDCSGYHGRGYVQLTGIDNYRKASQWTGVDLVSNPAKAADPALSAKIICHGMKIGGFTESGSLNKYIPPGSGTSGFSNARNMINPYDRTSNGCHSCVAAKATNYYKAISQAQQAAANQPQAAADATATANQPQAATEPVASGCGDTAPAGESTQTPQGGWCNPMPGAVQTAPYGEQPHSGRWSPPHGGIDLAGAGGATIYAAADGIVDDAYSHCVVGDRSCGGGYGNLVVIRHNGDKSGWLTFYGHNRKPLVKKGQPVKCGQPISIQGTTGSSSGDHLHFETNLGNDFNHRSPRHQAGMSFMPS